MPLQIGASLRAETQKTHPTEPFLYLYEIVADQTVSATTLFRLVAQPQTVSFDGKTYYPFPVGHSDVTLDSEGSLPETELSLSNVSRELPRYLEVGFGFIGMPASIIEVSRAALTTANAITRSYVITSASLDADSVTFRLETEEPHRIRSADRVYNRTRCRHRYGDGFCRFVLHSGLPANLQVCPKDLSACIERGNYEVSIGRARMHPRQFGGFPLIIRGMIQ